jgi:hypothetical protein
MTVEQEAGQALFDTNPVLSDLSSAKVFCKGRCPTCVAQDMSGLDASLHPWALLNRDNQKILTLHCLKKPLLMPASSLAADFASGGLRIVRIPQVLDFVDSEIDHVLAFCLKTEPPSPSFSSCWLSLLPSALIESKLCL